MFHADTEHCTGQLIFLLDIGLRMKLICKPTNFELFYTAVTL